MKEEKKAQEHVTVNIEELKEIIRETVRSEMESALGGLHTIGGNEAASPYGAPGDMTVQPAGFWGSAWDATKRVGKATAGIASTPFTAVYSMATQDADAVKWSARQAVDGVAGSGTWNQASNYVNAMYYFRRQPVYNYGILHHFDFFCGRCNSPLGSAFTPVVNPMNCPNCNAHLVPGM